MAGTRRDGIEKAQAIKTCALLSGVYRPFISYCLLLWLDIVYLFLCGHGDQSTGRLRPAELFLPQENADIVECFKASKASRNDGPLYGPSIQRIPAIASRSAGWIG
jgi:hypothetical protein